MSVEEAIKNLDIMLDSAQRRTRRNIVIPDLIEAIEMAIEALKEKNEKKQEWIPCSERMPEHGEQVLLWVKEKGDRPLSIKPDYHVGRLEHMNGDPDGKSNFWGIPVKPCEWRMQGWSYFFEPDVLAWMPLPERYREEASE